MKTKQQITETLFRVLGTQLKNPNLRSFHTDARFREDLGLDSASVLQMLVALELEFDLPLPDEALLSRDLDTVRDVAKVLYDGQKRPVSNKILEYEEDIKLHCFVSCLSEIVKRHPNVEHRVFYFGVWDSDIVVSDDYVISYHSETISHQVFIDWYERLYGIRLCPWYDRAATKEENVQRLVSLVEGRRDNQHIMVMLDMFQLPERVNEFNKDPFPHYLMLGRTPNPEDWMVYDPDYRWEGVIRKDRILKAMRSPAVAGGYLFTDENVHDPQPGQIKAYFDSCFMLDRNPMTEAIRQILSAHLCGQNRRGRSLPLSQLGGALAEVPILSIRKYAYEHGLAFFWRELQLPETEFDAWCDTIAQLVKTYKLIHFQALKVAATGSRELADKLFEYLDDQDAREFRIKRRLHEVYSQWCSRVFSPQRSHLAVGITS